MSQTPSQTDLSSLGDYPALRQLGAALYRTEGTRGAAVLVGAGVSRGAVLSSANMALPPLWSDLARAMAGELYASDPLRAPTDPLRLAEEYRTYFGQAALDAFVRRHIVDAGWSPSENHHALLGLPWSDVLTTNYDTLLERAARRAERHYEPVLLQADLAHARAPRIVKLHGSIGGSEHFVIAEEDYRTYPASHAAFVNLARQVFVENELCLLGFSGDDPNFLAWTGWIRDHLGSSARRIYLAGALDLGPAKRKFLEARNIAPIDLHAAVAGLDRSERHDAAMQLLLAHLQELRPAPPHMWRPRDGERSASLGSKDYDAEAKRLDAIVDEWRADRTSYPGWLVCPHAERQRLRFATDAAPINALVIERMPTNRVTTLMVELCWRHRTALWPIPRHMADLIARFADPAHLARADNLTVAVALLEAARVNDDEAAFARSAAVIETLAEPGSDALATLRYGAAVRACLDMDFAQAVSRVGEIVGTDPIWTLRRAGLLVEIGQLGEAEALVAEAVQELRDRQRANRGSLWIASRLAWAELFAHAFRRDRLGSSDWPQHFRETRCDPWKEVESLADRITAAIRKQTRSPDRITPRFDVGTFHDPSRTIQFGSATEVEPFDELDALLRNAGIPPRLTHQTFFGDDRLDALELIFEPTLDWHLHLCRSGLSQSNPLMERYFARVALAKLSPDLVAALAGRLQTGRDYWIGRVTSGTADERGFAIDRLALTLELLGRLAVRLDSNAARSLHEETLAMWAQSELRAVRLGDPVGRLLKNSFEAVSPDDRPGLAYGSLELELSEHGMRPDPMSWLAETSLEMAAARSAFRQLVQGWLDAAQPANSLRAAALGRLAEVSVMGALNDDERTGLATAAWASVDEGDPSLPVGTNLLPHFWTTVPAPDGIDVADTVRRRLFDMPDGELRITDYTSMIRAARNGGSTPTADQARIAFDLLVKRRPKPVDETDAAAVMDAAFSGYDPREEAHNIGATITFALAPFLQVADLTVDRASAIARFVEETGSPSATAGLIPFLEAQPATRETLAGLVRRGLVARDKRAVRYAADAMRLWCEAPLPEEQSCPAQLVEQLVSSIELRRAPALWSLLGLAAFLARRERLTDDQHRRLAIALDDLLVETDYTEIDPQSEEAGTVSVVRARCAGLALALRGRGVDHPSLSAWEKTAARDPLPEVRYASRDAD